MSLPQEIRRPDPASYSQEEQFALGSQPSWNSPDIITNSTFPWGLLPEVSVTVRNRSGDATAVNVLVHLFRATFGLGLDRIHESTKIVTLAPLQETTLSYPLPPSVLGGDPRIGVYTVIEHPSDAVAINNRGAQVIDGATTTAVGRSPSFTFPVRNPGTGELTLGVLANDLGAAVSPPSHMFAPGEQIVATLTLTVPAALHGSAGAPILHEVTVVARDAGGALVDGLTYLIWIDD